MSADLTSKSQARSVACCDAPGVEEVDLRLLEQAALDAFRVGRHDKDDKQAL